MHNFHSNGVLLEMSGLEMRIMLCHNGRPLKAFLLCIALRRIYIYTLAGKT